MECPQGYGDKPDGERRYPLAPNIIVYTERRKIVLTYIPKRCMVQVNIKLIKGNYEKSKFIY